MAYEPCGSKKLEGDDILKLLAKELNIEVGILRNALLELSRPK